MIRCLLANSLWHLAAGPEARRFRKALRRPADAQEALLLDLLLRNEGTRFGVEHGFADIRTVEEYRDHVPLRTYEDFAPWIEGIRRGEREVLTADAVSRLVPTGGSSAGRKLIPWTSSLGRDFRRALAPWVADLFRQHPDLKRGPAYWSVSPPAATPETGSRGERSAVPIGFDGDSDYLGGPLGALIRPTLAVPQSVSNTGDPEEFEHATLECLLRCRKLRLVSVWHPSFFALLLDRMEERWEGLLARIEGGAVRDGKVRGDSGSGWGILPPDPARARELRGLGPRAVDRIWPRLGLISCWTDAGARASARALRERLPHVPMQGKGLLATEGFSSIPFRGGRPLAVRSHFFEFVDAGGDVRLAHQLEEGGTYALVLTTSGGLYRYRTHDRVQVTGWMGRTPSLRFVGRGDRVSDLRGEKLTDDFVRQVLERLFGADAGVRFAMLAPEEEGTSGPGSAGYTLFVEASTPVAGSRRDRLDLLLQENPQYRWARELGQLAPPRIVQVREGAHCLYLKAQMARGRRLGDIKPVALDTRTDWRAVFHGAGAVPEGR